MYRNIYCPEDYDAVEAIADAGIETEVAKITNDSDTTIEWIKMMLQKCKNAWRIGRSWWCAKRGITNGIFGLHDEEDNIKDNPKGVLFLLIHEI